MNLGPPQPVQFTYPQPVPPTDLAPPILQPLWTAQQPINQPQPLTLLRLRNPGSFQNPTYTPITSQPRGQPLRQDRVQESNENTSNRYIDSRNLKLPKFKGKNVESWVSMVKEFAKALRWSETERRLHIKANMEDWIRSMFAENDDFTAEEMLHQLTMRFGVTMSHPEVHNELVRIVRKPNEGLHELADRVRNLARKAHMPDFRRQHIMRDVFFAALRKNKELQHYVDRYDDLKQPNMMTTLNLALDWEMKHGTQHSTETTNESNDDVSSKSETSTQQNILLTSC